MTTVSSTSSASAGRSAALAGIGFMLVATFLFALSSAVGKWLVATYPVGQFLLIRSGVTLLLLSSFIWRAGKAAFVNMPRPGLQLLRIVVSTAEIAMFFWAVTYMPLADATTFYLAGPIFVTALSVLLLGERVGWRRWTAVLIGFAGVVIALRPSAASFTLPALIALAGSIFYALLMIVTRTLRESDYTVLITTQFLGVLAFGLVTAPFGWVAPGGYDLLLMAGLGISSMLALFCVVRSLKLATASVVVPYQYTLIVWSVLFGFALFGELPDAYTLVGAAIIVAAGLYIFWREQLQAREAATSRWSCRDGAGAIARPRLAGIGLMLLGVFLFSFNDAVGKWLVATYSVGQLLLIRSATTLILLAPFIWRAGRAAFIVRAAARPAGPAHRAVDARSRDVLLGGRLSAARRRDHVLSGRPDLRDGDLGAVARGAGRLAALDRGAGRLPRRRHRAAALRRHVDAAGADRARREPLPSRC